MYNNINSVVPGAPRKQNNIRTRNINGESIPFDLTMQLLHRKYAFSTHNVCGICATPTSNDCSNHSDYLSLCNECCPEVLAE